MTSALLEFGCSSEHQAYFQKLSATKDRANFPACNFATRNFFFALSAHSIIPGSSHDRPTRPRRGSSAHKIQLDHVASTSHS